VDGVDIGYIGPTDLSMSMFGTPSKWGSEEYLEVFNTVLKASNKAGKPIGIHANSDRVEWAIEKGFKFNSVDSDDRFLMWGASVALQKAKNAVPGKGSDSR
jgi:2-keto-3-deoxy-L-rhamnonate aldolase RhmA